MASSEWISRNSQDCSSHKTSEGIRCDLRLSTDPARLLRQLRLDLTTLISRTDARARENLIRRHARLAARAQQQVRLYPRVPLHLDSVAQPVACISTPEVLAIPPRGRVRARSVI